MSRSLATATLVALVLFGSSAVPSDAAHPSCTVDRVIDGDTFVCTSGTHVRMLQINAQELSDCGGEWAKAALANIFLRPGTPVRLDYDAVTVDRYGRHLAAPIVIGTDGRRLQHFERPVPGLNDPSLHQTGAIHS